MSAIQNLIKAHKAVSISEDTFTLKKFHAKYEADKGENKGKARMSVVGLETKYIPQYDANHPSAKPNVHGNGYRTRFILEDGSTVGSFSQAADAFFKFFAQLMGYTHVDNFLHIDIDGVIQVDVSIMELDGNRSTYQFDLLEEGSDLKGLYEYSPNAQQVLSGVELGYSKVIEIEAPSEAPSEAVEETKAASKKTPTKENN